MYITQAPKIQLDVNILLNHEKPKLLKHVLNMSQNKTYLIMVVDIDSYTLQKKKLSLNMCIKYTTKNIKLLNKYIILYPK